ncbi:MAG: hypothetical protein OCD76_12175 [Reichenbachiella sp.]
MTHKGLDLILIVKNYDPEDPSDLWKAVRPTLDSHDSEYNGDESLKTKKPPSLGWSSHHENYTYTPDN